MVCNAAAEFCYEIQRHTHNFGRFVYNSRWLFINIKMIINSLRSCREREKRIPRYENGKGKKTVKRFIYNIKAVPRLVWSDSVVSGSAVLYGGRYESRVAGIYLPTRTGNTFGNLHNNNKYEWCCYYKCKLGN